MSARAKLLSLLLAAGIALVPQVAQATTTLTITSGGNSVTSISAGDTLDVSGSGPILTDGTTEQAVYGNWSNQSLKLKDTTSIVKPDGWTLEYTTNGSTWTSTAPADLKTVVGVRTVGDVNSLGASRFQSSATSTALETAGSFTASASGGDGMDVAFAGDKVLNVFHHLAKIEISCHYKSDGSSCWGTTASKVVSTSYNTGNASMAYWDAASSKFYVQASNNSSEVGMVCVNFANLASPTLCPTPFTKLGTGVADDIGQSAKVGTKVYLPNATTGKMMCFNIATADACQTWTSFTTLPSDGAPTAGQVTMYGRASAAGGKVYFTLKGKIGCYDPATDALCGTSTGVSITAPFGDDPQYPLFPVRDTSGTLLGMCLYSTQQCVSPAGLEVTPSPLTSSVSALGTWMGTHALPIWNTYNAGIWAELNNKLYLEVGPTTNPLTTSSGANDSVFCFDFATGAACSGFGTAGIATFGSPVSSTTHTYEIYVIEPDPVVNNCLWTNGNKGKINSFNALTGAPGCAMTYATVQMPYTATVPRMSCQEENRVTQWDKAIFHAPAGISNTDLHIAILDTNGNAISGWEDKTVAADGILDLSTLTTATTGTKPTFQIDAHNVGGSSISGLTADVKYTAGNPEICFTLLAQENCTSVTNGGSVVADGLVSSTVISTPTSGTAQIDRAARTLTGTNANLSCASTILEVTLPTSGSSPNTQDPSSQSNLTSSPTGAGTTKSGSGNGLAATGAESVLGIEFVLGYYMLRRGSHIVSNVDDSEE